MTWVHLLQSQKEELEKAKLKREAEVVSMKTKPSYPDINQLTELLVTSLKPELSKLLASHDFASCLPTKLKKLPSKITGLSEEIKELKQHIKDMEIELLGDLIEIPTKLESFTSTISSLSSQVVELKNIQWKPPTEFLNFPSQISLVQEKLKTLDSLPSLLHKVTYTLNRFSTMVDSASGATSMNVPSAGQATALPAEGERNTKDAGTNLKDELIDLLGKDVMTQYYTKKLLFDKYFDKMLKRKKNPKITNCEVLTKKGPIILKIYKEDGSDEVISNLKTRVDQLTQTEQELKIDLNQPLKEQDPLNELIDLANKERKRTNDLRDHSRMKGYQFMLFNLYQLCKKKLFCSLTMDFNLAWSIMLPLAFALGPLKKIGVRYLNLQCMQRYKKTKDRDSWIQHSERLLDSLQYWCVLKNLTSLAPFHLMCIDPT
ncbi:hypothetical protein Tco_0012832 [Tanacetum coccineum]